MKGFKALWLGRKNWPMLWLSFWESLILVYIRELLHLHWDDNCSPALQLYHWPRQHLRHEAPPHVQGRSHHWQQERDVWPARVRTCGSVEQVKNTSEAQDNYTLLASAVSWTFPFFFFCLALVRALTRIWRACITMTTLMCRWWCAIMPLRLRSSQTGRGICWG